MRYVPLCSVSPFVLLSPFVLSSRRTVGGAMENVSFSELSHMIFDESDAICRFVREHPGSAQLRSEEGDTLLHLSCWAKRIDAVQALLTAGADVNARGESGRTPLHYAVYEGNLRSVPVVRALLARGADAEVMDDHGFSQADLAKIDMGKKKGHTRKRGQE